MNVLMWCFFFFFILHHILLKATEMLMQSYYVLMFFLNYELSNLVLSACHCVSLFRFGKKKEEKKEAKAALQRQKSDILSDLELERMKDERERWGVL